MASFESCRTEGAVQGVVKDVFASLGAVLERQEWEVVTGASQQGKGDLVFTWRGAHFVVETKHLSTESGHTHREQRRQGIRKVKEQARRYALHWAKEAGEAAVVLAFIGTNRDGLVWVDPLEG